MRRQGFVQAGEAASSLTDSLESLGRAIHERKAKEVASNPARTAAPSLVRTPPEGDEQPDFFVPNIADIAVKDSLSLMDLALFRLSKRHTRKAEIITHELPHATVEIAGGAHGMASVYDYDFILFCVSYLAEGMRLYKAGRGQIPPRTFTPHAADVLKFCRVPNGGRQYAALEGMLDRLTSTNIKITRHSDKSKIREARGGFRMVEGYTVTSQTATGHVAALEVTIPEWIYKGVVNHTKPEVLTVHPDYFLIEGGLARFVYRLARKAAGSSVARYRFATIHERSGSSGTAKKTTWAIRQLIKANDLPEYDLKEEKGTDGQPILVMTNRATMAQPTLPLEQVEA